MAFLKANNIICNSCNQQLTAKSSLSYMIICPGCGNIITNERNDSSTKVLPIGEDMSVIQTGTRGKLPNHHEFEVIGRYKIDGEDGYYNLWAILIASNGNLEWIIDSFGDYIHATSVPIAYEAVQDTFWNSDCDTDLELTGIGQFKLVAKPKITDQGLEGELPEMPEAILTCRVYELAGEQSKQALLIRKKDNKLLFICGDPLSWDSYHFENTRKTDTIGA